MWRSLSISKKIWVSLVVLLAGYFLSMSFGFIKGRDTEKRLETVSAYIFPASHKSQAALTAFKEQVAHYEDVYMIGDESLLEEAKAKSEVVKSELTAIERLAKKHDRDTQAMLQGLETSKDFSEV